jgi:uncharacterized protein YpmB
MKIFNFLGMLLIVVIVGSSLGSVSASTSGRNSDTDLNINTFFGAHDENNQKLYSIYNDKTVWDMVEGNNNPGKEHHITVNDDIVALKAVDVNVKNENSSSTLILRTISKIINPILDIDHIIVDSSSHHVFLTLYLKDGSFVKSTNGELSYGSWK